MGSGKGMYGNYAGIGMNGGEIVIVKEEEGEFGDGVGGMEQGNINHE